MGLGMLRGYSGGVWARGLLGLRTCLLGLFSVLRLRFSRCLTSLPSSTSPANPHLKPLPNPPSQTPNKKSLPSTSQPNPTQSHPRTPPASQLQSTKPKRKSENISKRAPVQTRVPENPRKFLILISICLSLGTLLVPLK